MTQIARTFANLIPALIRCLLASCAVVVLTAAAEADSPMPIADIRQMDPDTAAEGISVQVRGVITYFDARHNIAFVQDETGGVYFPPARTTIEPDNAAAELLPGMLVELSGRTRPGRFAPFIGEEVVVRPVGTAPLPRPLRPRSGQLLDPKFHSQWIEVEAIVQSVEVQNERLTLKLASAGRQFDAFVAGTWPDDADPPDNLAHSDVRVRGVYGSLFNDQRQLTGMRLFVPSIDELDVLDAGFARAFAQPPRAIGEVMQFNPSLADRVRVLGVVLAQLPGEGLFVRGEGGAILIETHSPETFSVGQQVDVVGFPALGSVRPVLKDAVIRGGETRDPPQPVAVALSSVSDPTLDGELIRVEGRAVDQLQQSRDSIIVLESVGASIYVRVPTSDLKIERYSWLAVTGICRVTPSARPPDQLTGDETMPDSTAASMPYSLIARSANDVKVLQTPSWWTPQRIGVLAAILAALVALTSFWGITLRRKVAQQTAVIAKKIEQETLTEERSRIARELHDTLEQELVGINMQLDTASSRLDQQPERARQSLDLARAMLRHSQAEAHQSVWNLRAQSLAGGDLADALREMIEPLNSPDGPRIELVLPDLPLPLSGRIEHHVFRVAQEAVTNALKHANASTIKLTVCVDKGQLRLTVRDDGRGFDMQHCRGPVNGHFGLEGIRERAVRLRGKASIDSRPQTGTTIEFVVPLDEQADDHHQLRT